MTRIMISRYNAKWASHMPVLIKALEVTEGPVLELGMGPFSTPLLHVLCEVSGRKLVSYESDPYYYERHTDFRNDMHEINFVEMDGWAKTNIDQMKWGLVFVDQHPSESRGPEAGRMANFATVVVIHDSQPESDKHHHYDKIYPLFKYRLDYKKLMPNTTMLSNFIDVSDLII